MFILKVRDRCLFRAFLPVSTMHIFMTNHLWQRERLSSDRSELEFLYFNYGLSQPFLVERREIQRNAIQPKSGGGKLCISSLFSKPYVNRTMVGFPLPAGLTVCVVRERGEEEGLSPSQPLFGISGKQLRSRLGVRGFGMRRHESDEYWRKGNLFVAE